MAKGDPCRECGRPTEHYATQCRACYMRGYRRTSSGAAANAKWGKLYRAKHPEKQPEYAKRWRRKYHQYIPEDLRAVKRATQYLERVLARASHGDGVREPGQDGSDDGAPGGD